MAARIVNGAGYPFDLTTISAPDGSVTAKFVSFGATMTELWVKDKFGKARDVILGYDDNDTLHGGIYGWDRRNWTVISKTPYSVTYRHVDNADEGFPGIVTAYTTHSVSNGGILKTTVHAEATEKTPIMLTQHIYWNLDAFQNNSSTILDHHLRVDSSKVVAVDSNAVPTGEFISAPGTPYDFRKEMKIGARWNDTTG
ncbi:hypothetical protein VKT23_018581 [Stygiomarasmius scandens]|uniref:Aldose 1-epimerase n=1 Tax=Marasmiellus scandens TaxID=2682957 RepID=A0ABR1INU8_9AGAR